MTLAMKAIRPGGKQIFVLLGLIVSHKVTGNKPVPAKQIQCSGEQIQ